MRIFITGISGLLGLNASLQLRDEHQVAGCYHTHPVGVERAQVFDLDVTRDEMLETILSDIRADLVINTIAMTNVEACEANPGMAYSLNVETARYIAGVAHKLGIKLVHISTDHLFDGKGSWKKEEDNPSPLNVYASTKLQAEEQVIQAYPGALVIRTNFFAWGTSIRQSFSDWIIESLRNDRELTMFSDVFFTPIASDEMVNAMMKLVERDAKGVFHVSGAERISKHAFALCLADVFRYPTDNILPISVNDFPFRAMRPKDMSLNSNKTAELLRISLPSVRFSLELLKDLEKEGRRSALGRAQPGDPVSQRTES